MAEDDEVFGLDDELPDWLKNDVNDTPEELDGLDPEGMLEEPVP